MSLVAEMIPLPIEQKKIVTSVPVASLQWVGISRLQYVIAVYWLYASK